MADLSLEHYRAMVESALDCIIVMAHDGTVAEFNPAAEATFGYTRDEATSKPLADLIIPERLRKQHWSGLDLYLKTGEGKIIGKRIEMLALRKDGSEFPVELTIVPLESDPPTFAGFIRDLSERERMRGELTSVREELSAVLRAAPVGITVQGPSGDLLYANQAAADILDIPNPDDLVAMPAREMIERFELLDEDRQPLPLSALPGRAALAGHAPEPVTICWRRKGSERERWSIVRAAPLTTAEGHVRLVVNTFVDITEQVLVRQQAEMSARRRTALYEVSEVLMEAESIDAAAKPLLEAIGRNLAWQVGAMWLLDRETDTIHCLSLWEEQGFDASEYRRLTENAVLQRGEGYPGRVLRDGEILWEPSIQERVGFARLEAAAHDGLQGAVFIPLQSPDGCLGVIEMLSMERLPLDEVWMEAFKTLGAQTGQFIARRWAEDLVEELSAPVLPLMKRCLLLPVIGTLDDRRVRRLQDKLPAAVHAARAKVVVLDVTGAVGLDRTGAQALANMAMVFQMLGCRTIMTGVSTRSSVELARLGIDLTHVITTIDLESGIAEASRLLDGAITGPSEAEATSV